MGHSNVVLIAAVEAEGAAKAAGGTLENRLRAAMEATASHWMATNEADQFNAAMEGTARTCDDEDLERMQAEMRRLQALEAMLSGGPFVDFEKIADAVEAETAEPIGAQKMWREVKAGARAH